MNEDPKPLSIDRAAIGDDGGQSNAPAVGTMVSPTNLAFIEQLYYQFASDPTSVDPTWAEYFRSLGTAPPAPPEAFRHSYFGRASLPRTNGRSNGDGARGAGSSSSTHASQGENGKAVVALVAAAAPLIRKTSSVSAERVQRLVEAYRETGHLAADLDPLGLVKRNAGASLEIGAFGLSEADLGNVFSSENVAGPDRTTLADLIELLRETYCRHIGVELAHIHDVELRTWLLHRMESSRNRLDLGLAERKRLLEKVIHAEVFEQFLGTKFLGKKRFSLEGGESVIPLLDRLIERAAGQGVTDIVIGMAHRGRLNVLANVLEKPAAQIFAEFIDKEKSLDGPGGGDVKYHLGYSVDRTFGANGTRKRVHVSLAFNPSHLEFVNTVVQGRVRAKQDRIADTDRVRCLPILLHGDAAFAGQGVVAEGLNMSELDGYKVGGTVHVVINNQIGFTTAPKSSYSSTYATDVARMLQIPIFHVNGEDAEAIAQVVDLAFDFRQRFHRDALIEVWCYRKWGHNEGDEPEFTQPLMYKAIKHKSSIRGPFLSTLRARPDGSDVTELSEADADEMAASHRRSLDAELELAMKWESPVKPSTFAGAWSHLRGGFESAVPDVPTAITLETLQGVGRAMTTIPAGFTLHPKLTVIKDRAAMSAGERPCNWGMGEALAFGSLLAEGVRVRLSGQDSRRGTFSHRHSVLVDYETGAELTPLAQIGQTMGVRQGVFEVRDSPLSEAGVLGFDYGYSLDMPEGLTIWEAQFGDFVNSAQVIVDQFVVSSEAKWHRVSGLVMLLPHGMEGQGPEHSSARLERFLNMSVRDSIQVCNLTTPAQFFHALRRQVLRPYRKPLIIMSPKSLLRHPMATSPLRDFTEGSFQRIIPDDPKIDPAKVERLLLCTGKVYYDLVAAREERKRDDVGIIRIEQLYPLRKHEFMDILRAYRQGTPVVWVQEEPRNMGAWPFINRQLPGELLGLHPWSCVAREKSASPAAGSEKRHKLEQAKLIDEAFAKGTV